MSEINIVVHPFYNLRNVVSVIRLAERMRKGKSLLSLDDIRNTQHPKADAYASYLEELSAFLEGRERVVLLEAHTFPFFHLFNLPWCSPDPEKGLEALLQESPPKETPEDVVLTQEGCATPRDDREVEKLKRAVKGRKRIVLHGEYLLLFIFTNPPSFSEKFYGGCVLSTAAHLGKLAPEAELVIGVTYPSRVNKEEKLSIQKHLGRKVLALEEYIKTQK